jgi:opacity protein-like surface antigen
LTASVPSPAASAAHSTAPFLYVKAGGAWIRDTHTLSAVVAGVLEQATTSKSEWGWTGGAGVEYALMRNWSVKAEYDVLLFGAQRYSFVFAPDPSSTTSTDIKQRVHTLKLGFNYRFDSSSPVAARY